MAKGINTTGNLSAIRRTNKANTAYEQWFPAVQNALQNSGVSVDKVQLKNLLTKGGAIPYNNEFYGTRYITPEAFAKNYLNSDYRKSLYKDAISWYSKDYLSQSISGFSDAAQRKAEDLKKLQEFVSQAGQAGLNAYEITKTIDTSTAEWKKEQERNAAYTASQQSGFDKFFNAAFEPITQTVIGVATAGLSVPAQVAFNAAMSIARGGDIKDVLKSSIASLAASQVPEFLKDVNSQIPSDVAKNAIINAERQVTNALLTGQDVKKAALAGLAGGTVAGGAAKATDNAAISKAAGEYAQAVAAGKSPSEAMTAALTGFIESEQSAAKEKISKEAAKSETAKTANATTTTAGLTPAEQAAVIQYPGKSDVTGKQIGVPTAAAEVPATVPGGKTTTDLIVPGTEAGTIYPGFEVTATKEPPPPTTAPTTSALSNAIGANLSLIPTTSVSTATKPAPAANVSIPAVANVASNVAKPVTTNTATQTANTTQATVITSNNTHAAVVTPTGNVTVVATGGTNVKPNTSVTINTATNTVTTNVAKPATSNVSSNAAKPTTANVTANVTSATTTNAASNVASAVTGNATSNVAANVAPTKVDTVVGKPTAGNVTIGAGGAGNATANVTPNAAGNVTISAGSGNVPSNVVSNTTQQILDLTGISNATSATSNVATTKPTEDKTLPPVEVVGEKETEDTSLTKPTGTTEKTATQEFPLTPQASNNTTAILLSLLSQPSSTYYLGGGGGGAPPGSSALAQALGVADPGQAYIGKKGKERKPVWNIESLKLKDELGGSNG